MYWKFRNPNTPAILQHSDILTPPMPQASFSPAEQGALFFPKTQDYCQTTLSEISSAAVARA